MRQSPCCHPQGSMRHGMRQGLVIHRHLTTRDVLRRMHFSDIRLVASFHRHTDFSWQDADQSRMWHCQEGPEQAARVVAVAKPVAFSSLYTESDVNWRGVNWLAWYQPTLMRVTQMMGNLRHSCRRRLRAVMYCSACVLLLTDSCIAQAPHRHHYTVLAPGAVTAPNFRGDPRQVCRPQCADQPREGYHVCRLGLRCEIGEGFGCGFSVYGHPVFWWTKTSLPSSSSVLPIRGTYEREEKKQRFNSRPVHCAKTQGEYQW